MCIRDRPKRFNVKFARLDTPEQARAKLAAGMAAWVRVEDAVSYTHLRAHETVLDIVCRLLLEQKKNHQQISNVLTQYTIYHN